MLPAADRRRCLRRRCEGATRGASRRIRGVDEAPPAPRPPMANAVGEGPRVEQTVLLRGSYSSPGELVQPAMPVVSARAMRNGADRQGSGRRELAAFLASPTNPLTARVMVNRLWQWHFGEGLVRTPNNFGLTGEAPDASRTA